MIKFHENQEIVPRNYQNESQIVLRGPQHCIFNSVSFLLKFTFLFNKMHELCDFKTS